MLKLSRKSYKEEIDDFQPDFLFVESAWHGNDDTWVNVVSKTGPDLVDLVEYCKAKGIPTIFWCKEDPPQYETFKQSASLFDWIFTTDINCVDKYKSDFNRENVESLMFAVQPKLQNPISTKLSKLNHVCFAGIYYRRKFPERLKLFEELADASMRFGLDIYDRFSYVTNTDDYKYPDKYKGVLKPYVKYEELMALYKRYDVVINLNSVSDSKTMFSRRVFDAIACGVCVLSTPSVGMEELFGDVVGVAHSKQEAEEFLLKVLSDELYRDKLRARGYTKIIQEHTYANRLISICNKINIKLPEERIKKVSIVVATRRPDYLDSILQNYIKQTYPHKELIIVTNSDDVDQEEYQRRIAEHQRDDISVFHLRADVPLGACLNFGFSKAKYDYLMKMDDDDYFGENLLANELVFFDFTDADIIGKNSFYVYFQDTRQIALRYPGQENKFTKVIAGSAMIFRRKVFENVNFDDGLNVSEIADFLHRAEKKGHKIYSTHRFNHAVIRRDVKTHTWRESEADYLKRCVKVLDHAGMEELSALVDL